MAEQTSEIAVLLADDHDVVRQGLAAIISQEPGFSVVAQCRDGSLALQEVERLRPDVLVIDLAMPGMNGLEVYNQMRRKQMLIPTVILTMHGEPRLVSQALSCGVAGFVTKEAALRHLLDAIRVVHAGGTYLGPGVAPPAEDAEALEADPYRRLTARERQILRMIGRGQGTRTIAESLNISCKTVGTHRVRIMRKLNIHHQVALARYAMDRDAAESKLPL